jgi:hypothetical protein
VRRLMRENDFQAANRSGRPRGPRSHDGTIIPDTIDTMWGTDMTSAFTVEHGQVAVFVAVDHCSPSASASMPLCTPLDTKLWTRSGRRCRALRQHRRPDGASGSIWLERVALNWFRILRL